MERLPSRSPGIPGMFLPHPVLWSFDQLLFEVLPHTPRVLAWMTSIPDCRLWRGTRSGPSHTANYNLALGCHFHTLQEGIDLSRSQGARHWCPWGYTSQAHHNQQATEGAEPGALLFSYQYGHSLLHRQVSRPPLGSPPYVDHHPTGSSASSFVLWRHLNVPVHDPLVSALRPLLYGHIAVSAFGPLLQQSWAITRDSRKRSYRLATYSSIVRVSICVWHVGKSRSMGNRGLHLNIR